jgi:hypothetical protein
MWLGSQHVEEPYIFAGQIATTYYFSHFLFIIPLFGIIDNVLTIIGISNKVSFDINKHSRLLGTKASKSKSKIGDKTTFKLPDNITLENIDQVKVPLRTAYVKYYGKY